MKSIYLEYDILIRVDWQTTANEMFRGNLLSKMPRLNFAC